MRKKITALHKKECKQLFFSLCLQGLTIPNKKPLTFLCWQFRKAGYNLSRISATHLNAWILRDKCRYCHKPLTTDNISLTYSYWSVNQGTGPIWYACHLQCQAEGYRQEAYDCQNIDQNCNDCLYYTRKKNHKYYSEGYCEKFQKNTHGNNDFAQLNSCFITRKLNYNA
ncbi:MAG: hypothetical protein ULS35scaffold63_35 [Phage 33_17]|nr:MAG: hypothetical protein ULS35scaffold63_35 [Phage 33_17]